MRNYNLPDGNTTNSIEEYVKAWEGLAEPLCKIKGVVLHGCDPTIQIRFGDKMSDDGNRLITGEVIDMSVSFVLALNEHLKKD